MPTLKASSTDKLNISDLESKTLHQDSDIILNFFLISNSGLLNLIDFSKPDSETKSIILLYRFHHLQFHKYEKTIHLSGLAEIKHYKFF